MFKEFFSFIGYKIKEFFKSRLFPLCLVFLIMLIVIVVHLYNLQIINGSNAQEQYLEQKTVRTVNVDSTRGNIYDRDGELLAYNKLVYSVTMKDSGEYNGYEKNKMIIRLLNVLDNHNTEIVESLPLYIDNSGKVQYSITGETEIHGLLRDVYGKRSYDEVLEDDSCDPNLSAEGMYELLYERYGIGRNSSNEADGTYDISKKNALRVICVRYLLATNAYQRYKSVVVAKDVNEDTMTEILEHSDTLLGVDIEEDYKRVYNDGLYFAHVIGYTGTASSEELQKLNENYSEDDPRYVVGDVVGKTGIEASMEDELQGIKGSKTMYLDSLGRILEVTDEEDPTTGNDIYLTIDKDLQIGIYHIIEQHLAGVLVEKIKNEKVYNEPGTAAGYRYLSIYECYYQMINNNILDTSNFSKDSAGENEHRIYYEFQEGQKEAYQMIRDELLSDNPTAYKDLDGDIPENEDNFKKIFFSYAYDVLVNDGYLIKENIDTSDDTYKAYKTDETISFQEFLKYAISKNWIDVSKLDLQGEYTSANDTYNALVDRLESLLADSETFNKKVYKYLIYNDRITGCEVCLALFEQGVLENDESAKVLLSTGSKVASYEFMMSKISNLEITPAMLAMDPCSAAVTVVDPDSGEVLACVSYPSYDNNRLSGSIDTEYYNSLVNDLSSPLYNTATQAQKAPGSVFKLVTTAASLEEKVVSASDIITPEGVFTKQGLNLACTYYTNTGSPHPPENIITAIEQSCNYFFCEMGWRLSQVKVENGNGETTYNEPKGLEVLEKYARMMGLGDKTGIELNELEPHISDEAPIPSAIGQGKNVFSNVQLARYAATIANSGTVYELTLIDKITDRDGGLLSESEPNVLYENKFSSYTWKVIHDGMRAVTTTNTGTASNITCEAQIAGKTGTAEESTLRPNHANFVSYAPYNDPDVSIASTIIYGYSASNSVKITSDVYDLYYGKTTLQDILDSGASNKSGQDIID